MRKISAKQKIILILFGVFLSIVLLEIGLRFGGFLYLSLQEHRNRISIKKRGAYRILCLGESTTAIGDRSSYPHQLEEVLNQQNLGIKFIVINKGVPGIDTTAIVAQLEENLTRYSPDMVITMMGINDGANTAPYKDIPAVFKTIQFFKSLRIYKLARLLWLNFENKVKGISIYKLKKGKVNIAAGVTELMRTDNSIRQEEALVEDIKKAIAINPRNDHAYAELGRYYRDKAMRKQDSEMFDKAITMFKKALTINPQNEWAYVALGWCWCYKYKVSNEDAIAMFKKALTINPRNDWAYTGLGWCYKNQAIFKGTFEMFDKAIAMFKKALTINPRNDWAYTGLGWCYKYKASNEDAIAMFKKALTINPRNDCAPIALDWCYKDKAKYQSTIKMSEQATAVGFLNDYNNQGKFNNAIKVFKKLIENDPKNDRWYGALALYYERLKQYKSAEDYFREAKRLRLENYNPITGHNYQRLKEIVTKRGIKLICVQYPMRNIELLKKMLEPGDGIVFVDNEKVFKEALKQEEYYEYFTDIFGGDFGHCTKRGNKLLAENIANAIPKEYFHK